jgi:transposase
MTDQDRVVFGGADTHRDTIHVAVVDQMGRHLADQQVPATRAGYAQAVLFWAGYGRLAKVGVEGTSSYGAGLSEHLRSAGIEVVEVDRPDRSTRRRRGKSDPIDAYAAAAAVASQRATTVPKTRDGAVEAIRVLRVARASAIKARTQTINQVKNLIVTAPIALREALTGSTSQIMAICADMTHSAEDFRDPTTATKAALASLAHRYRHLTDEITRLDQALRPLVAATAPDLVALPGVGTDVAGQLLVTAGDNPHRLHSEAAFAHLCGAAPIPASSGRTDRHRLNRGGDRQANRALHVVALTRLRHDPRTRDYVERRTKQGLSRKDIIRCLKRYIARDVYRTLTTT